MNLLFHRDNSFNDITNEIIEELPDEWHFVYLYVHPKFYNDSKEYHIEGKKYINSHYYTYCRGAYLVSLEGAKLLLKLFGEINDNGDVMIGRYAQKGLFKTYMSKQKIADNLGQLNSLYKGEKLKSNIWETPKYRQGG